MVVAWDVSAEGGGGWGDNKGKGERGGGRGCLELGGGLEGHVGDLLVSIDGASCLPRMFIWCLTTHRDWRSSDGGIERPAQGGPVTIHVLMPLLCSSVTVCSASGRMDSTISKMPRPGSFWTLMKTGVAALWAMNRAACATGYSRRQDPRVTQKHVGATALH